MNTVGKSGKQDSSEALKVAQVCVCVFVQLPCSRFRKPNLHILKLPIHHTYICTYVRIDCIVCFYTQKKGEAEPAIIEDHNPVGLDLAVF